MKKKLILNSFLLLSLLSSCDSSKKSNKVEFISEDVSKLQNILDVSQFKPESVKFLYIYYDNSEGTISGPSDSFLEAELFYDKSKIDSLKNNTTNLKIDASTNIDSFINQWFNSKTANEVGSTQEDLKIYEDFLYNTNGTILLLGNKILYKK